MFNSLLVRSNHRFTVKRLVTTLLPLLLAACATPATRIEDNPAAFAAATPEQQELIKKGRVKLGMSPDMVKIALGDPDQVTEREEKDGIYITWHYASDVSPYPYPYPYPYRPFRGFIPPGPVTSVSVADKFRVVFFQDQVIAAERLVDQ